MRTGRGRLVRTWACGGVRSKTTVTTTMDRRKFIIGAGSLAAGGAAALGSGAFTSVDANRDISIAVAGDASAFLKITPAEEDGNTTPNAKEYVFEESDGTLALDFTNTNETEDAGGKGLNEDATTIFDALLDFTNQGTQTIRVGAPASGYPGSFYAENTRGNGQQDNTSFDIDDFDNSSQNANQTIAPGETIENVGYYVKNPEDKFEDDSTTFTVTFRAAEIGNNLD